MTPTRYDLSAMSWTTLTPSESVCLAKDIAMALEELLSADELDHEAIGVLLATREWLRL